MKRLKQAVKYGSTAIAMGVIGTSQVFAVADTTVTDGISASITNASDTAKAVGVLLLVAMVAVYAVYWGLGMLRKGKSV